jgi:aminoglycoside phosphotransferase (APT) family kinase protein
MHKGEIAIHAALVLQLIYDQFPQFANQTVEIIHSTGTVNAIFRLGNELCVRLPRKEDWAANIHREWTWLLKLKPHLSLAVPEPVAMGEPTVYYPYPWAIYRWIKGMTYQDKLIGDERQAAQDLAIFIRELREFDTHGAPQAGRKPLAALDASTREAIAACGSVIDKELAAAAWADALGGVFWDGTAKWIHADLLPSNLLIRDGRIYAVLDFGSAGIGDPAHDVTPAWAVFNNAGRETFREALSVDEDTWRRARGYALHQAVMIIPYYAKTNPVFVRSVKDTIKQILLDLEA